MEFNDAITERTTAGSDAVLACLALGCVLCLWRVRESDPWRLYVWSLVFGLTGAAAALGAVVHGFHWPPQARTLLWQPLYISLFASVCFLAAGVADYMWGRRMAIRSLAAMIVAAIGVYAFTALGPSSFLPFAVFELSAMTFAVVGCGWLAAQSRRADYALMTAGAALSVLAALVQTQHSVSLNVIWEFDHNGVFHLIQMPSALLLAVGVRRTFVADALSARDSPQRLSEWYTG
jgi:hypothetical protein